MFAERARAVLAAADEAEEHLAARRECPAGRLRVDAASPFMLHAIVPLVAGYRAAYPQVTLELSSHDGLIDLLEHRTDVAVRIGRLKDSTLHARPIGNSPLRVLASPAYLQAHGTPQSVADLACHTLLGFTQPSTLNEWPLPDPDGGPLHIAPALSASSGETLRQLALEHVGIVCLSDFMTWQDRAAGRLVQVLTPHTLPVRQPVNAVYYRNTALSSRIASFVDHLARHWCCRIDDDANADTEGEAQPTAP